LNLLFTSVIPAQAGIFLAGIYLAGCVSGFRWPRFNPAFAGRVSTRLSL
jgi:hypothetical protein